MKKETRYAFYLWGFGLSVILLILLGIFADKLGINRYWLLAPVITGIGSLILAVKDNPKKGGK